MTNDEKRTEVERIVRQFTMQYVERKLLWQLGQIVPGADQIPAVREALMQLYSEAPDALQYTMEPQEWRTLALYGAGIIDGDPAEMQEIVQSMAEWFFSLPTWNRYDIPDWWADTELGALWWQAVIRIQGDELITIAEAAQLAGVSVQAISQRIKTGTLDAYTDPLAPSRQGRQLVRRQDVEAKPE